MIISEEIQVKIHSKNIIFYKNSGFSNISIGDFIKIYEWLILQFDYLLYH